MREEDGGAAAGLSACAFSSDSLFLFLRRRSLADFLALFRAFSILLCFLSDRTSAEGVEETATADEATAMSSPEGVRAGRTLVEASGGVDFGPLFPLFFLCPAAASEPSSPEGVGPVSCAVAGDERARTDEEEDEAPGTSVDAARDAGLPVAAARLPRSF